MSDVRQAVQQGSQGTATLPPPEERTTVEEVTTVDDDTLSAVARLARSLPRYTEGPTADQLRSVVESPATRLLVARGEDGVVAGMMTLAVYRLPTSVRAWLEDVAVARHGRGVGRQLTEEALRLAREAGARDVELIVKPTEAGGLKMASLMGFGPNDEDTRRIRL